MTLSPSVLNSGKESSEAYLVFWGGPEHPQDHQSQIKLSLKHAVPRKQKFLFSIPHFQDTPGHTVQLKQLTFTTKTTFASLDSTL